MQKAGVHIAQQKNEREFAAQINIHYGQLSLNKITVELDKRHNAKNVQVLVNNNTQANKFFQTGAECVIELTETTHLEKDNLLLLKIG